MGSTFRPARREDLPRLVALLADDPLGGGRECTRDPPPDAYRGAFEEIEPDPRNHLVVAEVDGRLAGLLQLTLIPTLSRLGGLRGGVRVAAEHRGQGVGRALIEHALERCREAGCTLVQLTTDTSRADALRFYEGLGFTASHHGLKLDLRD